MICKVKRTLNIDYSGNYFDLIQLKQVLEHVLDPCDLIKEIYRILRKEGVLIIDVPNQEGLIPQLKIKFGIKKEEYGFLQPLRHIYAFTSRTLRGLLEIKGFKIKRTIITTPGDAVFCLLIGQKLMSRIINKYLRPTKLGSILVIYAQK